MQRRTLGKGNLEVSAIVPGGMRMAALVLSLCLNAVGGSVQAGAPPKASGKDVSASRSSHLGSESTIGDILRHPAFLGFGHLILPWDDRAYDEGLSLARISSLLPYHTHVDPETVANALNRMIDDAGSGRTVFYSFYSEAQKKKQPARKNTGLFFFRGNPGAPFAVIAPGGGFSYVGSVHEGFPYAEAVSRKGYNAFVLRYRTGYGSTAATEDLAAAVSYIIHNAAALGVVASGYSLWGSSAGARMAAAIGSHGVARYGGSDVPKPAAIMMAYTAHSDYSSAEPPTFVVVGEQDRIAPPASMEARVEALRKSGTPVEYHKYRNLGHGFGLGIGTSAEGWVFEAIRFWETSIRRQRAIGDFVPKLAELTDNVLYGDIWERSELSKRDRSLVTLAALIALSRQDQLRSHLVKARENGVTQEEVIETITHLAFYAGWPNAVSAIGVAREVFGQK